MFGVTDVKNFHITLEVHDVFFSQTLTVNMENCNNHHRGNSWYIHLVVNDIKYHHCQEVCTEIKTEEYILYNAEDYLQHILK